VTWRCWCCSTCLPLLTPSTTTCFCIGSVCLTVSAAACISQWCDVSRHCLVSRQSRDTIFTVLVLVLRLSVLVSVLAVTVLVTVLYMLSWSRIWRPRQYNTLEPALSQSPVDQSPPELQEPSTSSSSSSTLTDISEKTGALAKKRQRLSIFFGYKHVPNRQHAATESPEIQLSKYLNMINREDFDPEDPEQPPAYSLPQFHHLRPLFCKLWCVPATSAPVERIFSQSGIIMRPHRARMSDEVLEMLMFLKCNAWSWHLSLDRFLLYNSV